MNESHCKNTNFGITNLIIQISLVSLDKRIKFNKQIFPRNQLFKQPLFKIVRATIKLRILKKKQKNNLFIFLNHSKTSKPTRKLSAASSRGKHKSRALIEKHSERRKATPREDNRVKVERNLAFRNEANPQNCTCGLQPPTAGDKASRVRAVSNSFWTSFSFSIVIVFLFISWSQHRGQHLQNFPTSVNFFFYGAVRFARCSSLQVFASVRALYLNFFLHPIN